jgi:GNAT superfamily N-acetyltransferase
MSTQVVTHYLEMTDPAQLIGSPSPSPDWTVRRVGLPCPELNRFFYYEVGAKWSWVDRLDWTDDKWLGYVGRPDLETWVAYLSGTPVGYFELEAQPAGDVQLMYFGLLPRFIGRGCGGPLLTAAIEQAWQMGPRRVWVHTCSMDHPSALANYQARGFKIFEQNTKRS